MVEEPELVYNKRQKINELNGIIKTASEKHTRSEVGPSENIGIPMLSFPGSASDIEMYQDDEVKTIGYLKIPGAAEDSFALPVYGHSMYPTLENGNWAILRPLKDRTDIEWGEIYYLEYGDYRSYKRLLKADDEDSVTLWSDNQTERIMERPKYAPKTIKKEKIRKEESLKNQIINNMNANDPVCCPRCGSTQISANKRGWNLTSGMIGSNSIVITCLKCGKQFKPGPQLSLEQKVIIGIVSVIIVIILNYIF
jgi:hypothetical protein